MATIALPVLDHRDPRVPVSTLREAPHRDLCTDCGVSRMADPTACGSACQFIHPRYDALETAVHGRTRDVTRGDEQWFGPYQRMLRARLEPAVPGSQWTGITTTMAAELLRRGAVDAVIATASDDDDPWRPVPALVTRAEDMSRCKGMKMGYAPLVALVEEAATRGYRRLAFVGVACQVHALRALESRFGLERLYVIGTPCSDNTHTDRFHQFLSLLSDAPETITYLEFMPDMRVELRFRNGSTRRIPFIQLPIAQLPSDFFPTTCRSCFDYTNALSDVTVGYMAGEGDQWLIVRNARGEELVSMLSDRLVVQPLRSVGNRRGPVSAFAAQLQRQNGGLPLRRTPKLLRPLVGFMMSRFGPKGLEFARTRVEMKHVEGILTLRREHPRRMKRMIPDFAWALAAQYGLVPADGERDTRTGEDHTDTPFERSRAA